ncbi:NAD dependent epimerase/dehydratase family protein [Planctomycetes bacterium CA13]|uniref:NAD dependent epimerase/dehydratase family protein n=1 Tax=Novipirellula herctigrandis TaxID=2527986 RepID=A0A5C5Z582_9BACT|nr:NAD dependent epimerase/dehydratase family protein [Planctomycetes bacterium CA13]
MSPKFPPYDYRDPVPPGRLPSRSPCTGLRILVVGCGYLGTSVGRISANQGDIVYATTRNASGAVRLRNAGFIPVVVNWTDRRTLRSLPEVDRIVVAVSYDTSSRMTRYESQVGGLRNLLQATPAKVNLCYISTTGVYHQTDGSWVDERSPTFPTRQGGVVHLQAEELLHRYRPDSPWTILRLAGIYGPGRVPRIADVIAGRCIASNQSGFLNLIHVHDAARAVRAALQNAPNRLYAVSDNQPMRRSEFYREIARQCGAPMPSFRSPDINSSKQLRSESNKRIWNRRLRADLLPKLLYPTYRDGLVQVLST